jgi:uncharacterized protein with HEPN domain
MAVGMTQLGPNCVTPTDIEWNKLAGLRDIVAHKYFGLDEDILWDVIQHRIPALLDRVRQILAAKGEQ